MTQTPIALDATAISHHVELTWGIPCPAATIRQWAHRGLIRRLPGPHPPPRPMVTRYDLREVLARLRTIGWIPPD